MKILAVSLSVLYMQFAWSERTIPANILFIFSLFHFDLAYRIFSLRVEYLVCDIGVYEL